MIGVLHLGVFQLNRPKEVKYEQVQDPLMEWEIRRIIMRYHHRRREALVLKVKTPIWHVKGFGYHILGDSDRHTYHKGINSHYPTWVLSFLTSIL